MFVGSPGTGEIRSGEPLDLSACVSPMATRAELRWFGSGVFISLERVRNEIYIGRVRCRPALPIRSGSGGWCSPAFTSSYPTRPVRIFTCHLGLFNTPYLGSEYTSTEFAQKVAREKHGYRLLGTYGAQRPHQHEKPSYSVFAGQPRRIMQGHHPAKTRG